MQFKMEETTLSVQGCNSCGEDHESATVTHADAGGGTFTCPTSGNPVNFTYPYVAPVTVVPGVTEGRIVHYVMPPTARYPLGGQHRAAMIVNAHGGNLPDGTANITVFLDQLNDGPHHGTYQTKEGHTQEYLIPDGTMMCLGSVKYSEGKEIGTWHWPERT